MNIFLNLFEDKYYLVFFFNLKAASVEIEVAHIAKYLK